MVGSASDTIAAIATPPGSGGVAIIRVSGRDARAIVGSIFRGPGGSSLSEPRRVYVGKLYESPDGSVLDEVLVFAMVRPHSYTGEDVVEVQCHGGSVVSQRILEAVCGAGARPAAPGEFTKRAFLSGRIDLAQAEAVADMIAARSEEGRRLAWSQLEGTLSTRVGALRDAIVQVRARCEAALDFVDEDVPEFSPERRMAEVAAVRAQLERLIGSFERGRLCYHGARVALIGRPNVGKSSLLNALTGRDRALVTPVPGTTRDVIESTISVSGLPIVLLDTAGLRDTDDVVETLGVSRTRVAVDEASAVVVVFDRHAEIGGEDAVIARTVEAKRRIAVLNKADLDPRTSRSEVQRLVGQTTPVLEVSATTGEGIEALAMALRALVGGADDAGSTSDGEPVLFRVRHHDAALRSLDQLRRAERSIEEDLPLEIVASDLASAAAALEEITGTISSEDVLDRVFADFCIGK